MIRIFGDYFLTVDGKNGCSYVVGKRTLSGTDTILRKSARYYPSLAIATAETAELALRDAIAAGQVQTLQEAVEELRHIRDEIKATVNGTEVEQDGSLHAFGAIRKWPPSRKLLRSLECQPATYVGCAGLERFRLSTLVMFGWSTWTAWPGILRQATPARRGWKRQWAVSAG